MWALYADRLHPDEYSSYKQLLIRNWSRSFRNQAKGSNAPGKFCIHDEYSPGLDCRRVGSNKDVYRPSDCSWTCMRQGRVHGYLAYEKMPSPLGPHRILGICLQLGSRGVRVLMSEVPL